MLKKIFSSLFIVSAAMLQAHAAVDVQAGHLSETITDPASVTELVLTGSINAADMKFIATGMPSLKTLDLSGISAIEACSDAFLGNISSHPANKVPNNAFAGLGIESLTLPAFRGLEIGHGAFAGTSVTSVTIPATVASVGDGAFAGCNDLAEVVCASDKLGVNLFANCPGLKTVSFTAPVAVPDGCFYNDSTLVTVTGSVTSVGARAFAECAALKSFPFTASLTSVGREAFKGAGLNEVDLTACTSLQSIGDWAFAMMPDVVEINTGNVSEIGSAIAFKCPNLDVFTTSQSATEIPDFAFAKSSVIDTLGMLHDNIEYIGRYALSGAKKIETISLPVSLEELGDHAMENMTGLANINAQLSVVPAVGEDVWKGVDQSKVDLIVPNEMADAFKNAAQWQNFNVVLTSSSVETVVDATLPELRGRFDGDNLIVQALGVDIEVLSVYDPAGQLLVSVVPSADTVVIDTAGYAARIFLVHATLADGRNAALKLAKR